MIAKFAAFKLKEKELEARGLFRPVSKDLFFA